MPKSCPHKACRRAGGRLRPAFEARLAEPDDEAGPLADDLAAEPDQKGREAGAKPAA